MTDVLTQIQDELDNLLLRMSSSLATVRHRAPPAQIPGQPVLSSFAEHEAQQRASQAAADSQAQPQSQSQPQAQAAGQPPALPPPPELPVSQDEVEAQIKELSADLIAKEQQLEVLINALPGRGISQREQEERMRALERELEETERERREAVREREALIDEVERVILRNAVGPGA